MLPARPQLPEVSIEAEKANQIDSAPAIQPTGGRIPFGGRAGLFSSPRQRFRIRPQQPQAISDVNTRTTSTTSRLEARNRSRIFVRVGHETTCGKNHIFNKSYHQQTYQNYERPGLRSQNSKGPGALNDTRKSPGCFNQILNFGF